MEYNNQFDLDEMDEMDEMNMNDINGFQLGGFNSNDMNNMNSNEMNDYELMNSDDMNSRHMNSEDTNNRDMDSTGTGQMAQQIGFPPREDPLTLQGTGTAHRIEFTTVEVAERHGYVQESALLADKVTIVNIQLCEGFPGVELGQTITITDLLPEVLYYLPYDNRVLYGRASWKIETTTVEIAKKFNLHYEMIKDSVLVITIQVRDSYPGIHPGQTLTIIDHPTFEPIMLNREHISSLLDVPGPLPASTPSSPPPSPPPSPPKKKSRHSRSDYHVPAKAKPVAPGMKRCARCRKAKDEVYGYDLLPGREDGARRAMCKMCSDECREYKQRKKMEGR